MKTTLHEERISVSRPAFRKSLQAWSNASASLTAGEDPRWHSDGQTAHLRAPALKTTILAMTKLAPFVAAKDRPQWCSVRDVLQDLQSHGRTLQCSWLED